jgi:hypothetical protein
MYVQSISFLELLRHPRLGERSHTRVQRAGEPQEGHRHRGPAAFAEAHTEIEERLGI